MTVPVDTVRLTDMLRDSRARTLELVAGLDPEQLFGPRLDIVNPLIWEIGHLAWFHEHFALRPLHGGDTLLPNADALYDSSAVPHDVRWDLPLPSLSGTLDYMRRVQDALVARLEGTHGSERESYLYQLTTFHEDMHDEAFTYTRQTLGYPEPGFAGASSQDSSIGRIFCGKPPKSAVADLGNISRRSRVDPRSVHTFPENAPAEAGPWPGDAEVPAGQFLLGSSPSAPFVFDNEKWAHPVTVRPFRIARAPVTNAEFAAFVDDGGYRQRKLWDHGGWQWRENAGAEHPVYWIPEGAGRWAVCRFDRTAALQPHQPVIHVNWHEANAWCRWAGRRLPTEIEWEVAAAAVPTAEGSLAKGKRTNPWGEIAPSRASANLDGHALGCVDVGACAEGDSAWGCRQMIGNVWEWTASTFAPYAGFAADAYADYSAPWFSTRKVLRGGAWATRGRMINNTYRNFFPPDRRDILAGFRTVAL
jgi:iron(II)-dependent oxidoreductase